MTSLVPIVRNAGEGDKQSFAGGGLHLWKLLAEDTDGAFFLFEDTMVRDKTTPLHLHPEAHELTYVIDGEIEVEADGRQRCAAVACRSCPRASPTRSSSFRPKLGSSPSSPPAPSASPSTEAPVTRPRRRRRHVDLARLQATAADNPAASPSSARPPSPQQPRTSPRHNIHIDIVRDTQTL